jgi:selT/selW/selH-like putative selenoprotein
LYDYADDLPGGVLIRPGAIGSFEVYLDDRRVFSKLNDERFPEANEVEEQLGTLLMAT